MGTKRIVAGLLCVTVLVIMASPLLWGARLLTEEKALQKMLPGVDRIEKVTKVLTDEQLARITKRIGSMVLYQRGSKAKKLADKRDYTFYFGIKDNKKVSVAIFEAQPGKWGPVYFVIALDINTAKVKNMAVTAYVEKRGRPIARRSFLSQFFGKGCNDPIKVKKDIRAISGATISCRCAAFAVRKVIALYEELFLNIPLIDRLKDGDHNIRVKALTELEKLDKSEKDNLLKQLVEELSKKEVSECQKQAITCLLNSCIQSEITNKLQTTKLPAETALTGDLESVLSKIAESAQIKLVWMNDELKESAQQIKINGTIKANDTNNLYIVLDEVLSLYGCAKCRNPQDKAPTYTYNFNGDSIEIANLETAQKQWQKWWDSYKEEAKR